MRDCSKKWMCFESRKNVLISDTLKMSIAQFKDLETSSIGIKSFQSDTRFDVEACINDKKDSGLQSLSRLQVCFTDPTI